jgi:acyl carrier protein
VSDTSIEQEAAREHVLAILERVIGYEIDPRVDQLPNLDSLQVLELLVSLEEEFDIDSDQIIESRQDWWISLSGLVESVIRLGTGAR